MSQHLSSEQIDAWVIGERMPEVSRHLETCAACAGEVGRITGALNLFESAVRSWAQEQPASLRVLRENTTPYFNSWRVGLACALLMLLLISSPFFIDRHTSRETAATASRTAMQDEMLLRQVQLEISQSVPTPMEPLARLMPNDYTR